MITNLELANQIKANLNELIDRRGNTQLIPALVEVQSFIDKIHSLKLRDLRLLEARAAYDEPAHEVSAGPRWWDDVE